MKKIVTVLLVLALAGTMTTTAAFAAPDTPTDGGSGTTTEGAVLITAKATQGGQVAMSADGSEPEFDPEFPTKNVGETVAVGSSITLSVKADEGYKFIGWIDESGMPYSTDATITFEASEVLSLTAAFDLDVEKVLIKAKATTGGHIAMSMDGTDPVFDPDSPDDIVSNIPVGDTVILSAAADDGYKFMYWLNEDTMDIYSTDKTVDITAEENLTLKAIFDLDVEKVLIVANSSQGGNVAMSAEGSDPLDDSEAIGGGNAGGNIAIGEIVAFGAKPDEGWKFVCWINEETEELYSMDQTVYVTAEVPLTIKAVFDRDVERVLIIANSSQGGRVAMSENGTDPETDPDAIMGGNAGGNIAVGDTVTFSAITDEGWKFVCWMVEDTEELYSMDKTVTITAENPLTLKAVFDMDVERVLLNVKTEGRGQVALNEEGGDPEFEEGLHNDNVGTRVIPGNTVVVGAKADDGYKFVGWKDAATGKSVSTDEKYLVTVNENMEIVAVFELINSENKNGGSGNSGSDNNGSGNGTANDGNYSGSNSNNNGSGTTGGTTTGGTSIPTTGDTSSAAALAAITLGSLGAAVILGKKCRREEEK